MCMCYKKNGGQIDMLDVCGREVDIFDYIDPSKTCCFTGHRRMPDMSFHPVRVKLENALFELVQLGYNTFVGGGAVGFDMLAESASIELRRQFSDVRVVIIMPSFDYRFGWTEGEHELMSLIERNSNRLFFCTEKYRRGGMFLRDRALVDVSSRCISFMVKNTGGTAYTVKYAKSRGVKVTNLAEGLYTEDRYEYELECERRGIEIEPHWNVDMLDVEL